MKSTFLARVAPLASLPLLLSLSACGDSSGNDDEVGETASDDTSSSSTTAGETETGTGTADTETTTDTETADTETTTETDTETDTDTGTTTGNEAPPCPYDAVDGVPDVELEVVAEGLSGPTFVIGHPLEPNRLFVTLKGGDIVIVEAGATQQNPEPFLSLDVNDFSEMGVLSMDFHPDFPDDPRVYVHYSPEGALRSRVSEFTLDPQNPDVADPGSERILYDKPQSQANHNGGQVEFGPDGMLYFSIGDGGEQGDPFNRAQDLGTHYGKIMRVDVTPGNGEEYSIPGDNPFADDPGALPEIWAYGLRNAWRFAFDPQDGLMYTGDVGQNAYEEVDIVSSGGNYGWVPMEGNHCFDQNNCDTSAGPNQVNSDGYIAPIFDYGGGQRSITGGYVYRSCEVPGWDGRYFFADYVLNRLWALTWDGSSTDYHGEVATTSNVSSLGSNAWGDVYVVQGNFGFQPPHPSSSRIYRLAPQ